MTPVYVYLIQHIGSGKVYVGVTNDLKRRWASHRCNSCNLYLNRAIAKYGKAAFTFSAIEEHSNQRLALDAEMFLIAYFRSIGADLYNLSPGGDASMLGRKHSEATIAKMKAHNANPEYRAHMRAVHSTPEAIERMRLRFTGTKVSEETKAKMRITRNTPEAIEANRFSHIGKHHSEATKAKMKATYSNDEVRARITAIRNTPEYKANMRANKIAFHRAKRIRLLGEELLALYV